MKNRFPHLGKLRQIQMNGSTKHRNVINFIFPYDNQTFANISQEIFAAQLNNVTGNQYDMVIVWRNSNQLIVWK